MTNLYEFLKECNANLCVQYTGSKRPWLCGEVMYGNEIQFTLRFIELFPHEVKLADGRFASFVHSPLELVASIDIDANKIPIGLSNGLTFATYVDLIKAQINWCADQTADLGGKWGFSVNVHSVNNFTLNYHFDNPTVGVSFKLLWA